MLNQQSGESATMPEDTSAPEDPNAPTDTPIKFCLLKFPGHQFQFYKDDDEPDKDPGGVSAPGPGDVPPPTAPGAQEEVHDMIQGEEAMLKAVLKGVRAHPTGSNEQEHMNAGYVAEQGEG